MLKQRKTKKWKKARNVYDASFEILPTSIALNAIETLDSEPVLILAANIQWPSSAGSRVLRTCGLS